MNGRKLWWGLMVGACSISATLGACSSGDNGETDVSSQDVEAARASRHRASNKTCKAPARPDDAGTFPAKLSELGCFTAKDVRKAATGVVAYEPQAPLWSDGAGKPRYFAIPDGTTVHIEDNGHFHFPIGTVLIKSFVLGGRYVESRVFVRHTDGGWAGYSYEWNDAGTDADLLPGAKTKTVGGQSWTFPSRGQCMRCHNDSAETTLGLEIAQLNGPTATSAKNQLETLAAAGYFDAPLPGPVAALPRLARYDSNAPLEDRARAYLHANCAHCHRPSGPGAGSADYRFGVPFGEMHLCGKSAMSGRLMFSPGSPATSEVSVRIHAVDGSRMPPLGTQMVDPVGTALVDGWIQQTNACPGSADAGADGSVTDAGAGDAADAASQVDPSAYAPCDHAVALAEVQASVFNGCAGEACHLRPPMAANLDLRPPSAYASLVNVTSVINPDELRVVPGDPSKSFVWRKLTNQLGPGEGSPMPRGLSAWRPLAGDSLRALRCWIEQGAPR